MKKVAALFFSLFFVSVVSAQVFNTGQTIKQGNLSVGVEPMIIVNGGSDFILFGHLGYGITSGIDLGAKVGVLNGETYLGADLEFGINKNISVSAGAHVWGDFGLDATLLGTYPISKTVNLYGGLDADIILGGNTTVPLWIPIGVEIGLKKSLKFLFEASIGLNDPAYHLIGGGVVVYF